MDNTNSLLRKCVGCNEMVKRGSLFRLVRIEGKVSLDLTGKANGRGAYVCKNKDCINNAIKRKAFNRALKCPIPSEVLDEIIKELENGN